MVHQKTRKQNRKAERDERKTIRENTSESERPTFEIRKMRQHERERERERYRGTMSCMAEEEVRFSKPDTAFIWVPTTTLHLVLRRFCHLARALMTWHKRLNSKISKLLARQKVCTSNIGTPP